MAQKLSYRDGSIQSNAFKPEIDPYNSTGAAKIEDNLLHVQKGIAIGCVVEI
jgi:hypothetical protein